MRDHEQEAGDSPSLAQAEPGVFLPLTGWVQSCTTPGLRVQHTLVGLSFRLVVQESERAVVLAGDPQLSWSMLEQ